MVDNYALLRLQALGFDESRDFGLLDTYSGEVGGKKPKPRMYADDDGNLCIRIVDLDNIFVTYAPEKTFSKQSREILYIKRLANPEPGAGKYRPGQIGQGVYPCFWPFLLQAVKKKTKIKTLVITEGYIKSYVLDKAGVLCIGLPGITVWKEKGQTDIFKAIQDVVMSCDVQNIVWLTDGDTMHVEWVENKDLSKRPWSFFTSVRIFKEQTQELGCEQFWMHIHEKILHKGIDDLLQNAPESTETIIKELTKPSARDGQFFKRFNVGAISYQKIKEYFGIDDAHEGFYKKYEDVIGDRPFVYGKGLFQWDEESKKLKYMRAGEAAQYIMVDSTYYIKGALPTLHGNVENVLKSTKPASIKKKFQDKSDADLAKIFRDIPHYDGFINRPEHINYQPEYIAKDSEGFAMRYYNKYHRLSWNPVASTPELLFNSLEFVKHIFGTGTVEFEGVTYNEWDLGLDYIQLLYTNPTQKLPILCLVSETRQTGKSKFWEWMTKIFQQNVREISDRDLTGQFTSEYATNLLVYLEEAFIDRIQTMEKIKSLVTSAKGKLEAKFADSDRVDNFLKVGLSSNNVRNFANISTLEIRFWVRLIGEIAKDKYNPNFENELYAEIPAFLHYLQNRKLVTEYRSRSWFAFELIETEALRIIQRESKSSIEIMLDMVIREYISDCAISVVKLSPTDIKNLLKDEKISLSQIRWGMAKYGMEVGSSNHYYLYKTSVTEKDKANDVEHQLKKSATYKIYADTFFSAEECAVMFNKEQLLLLEEESIKVDRETWFQKLKDRKILIKKDQSPSYIDIIEKAESYAAYFEVIEKVPF
jgi:hypothetical protein